MANFKQVFLIQAHTDAKYLFSLVSQLDSSNHYFAIHIDKKSKFMLDDPYIKELLSHDNIFIISNYIINWGGANQFFVTLELIEKVVAKWPDIEYFHLISGQDFPTKNNKQIDDFFETFKDKNFMALATTTQLEYRYNIYYPRDIINTRECSFIIRFIVNSAIFIQQKLLDLGICFRRKISLTIFKGSNWWSLNREAINYIISFIKNNPYFKDRFKYTNCCDEIFFHTILFNSPLRDTIVEKNLRYIDWSDNGRGFPNVLDESDYLKIIRDDCFFCRKIIPKKSDKLVELLKNKQSNWQ